MTEAEPTLPLSMLGLTAQGGRDVAVSGLSVDSRKTRLGHLFAALPGVTWHVADFIDYALRMGAAAVLTDREGVALARDVLDQNPGVPLVVAEDPRAALAMAAAL
ncbi:MAG TPA: UDP-N-acetylmuramoyl-L-alanyl-D-glutamate--2,6-diaminopimelate ligase, partial [Rhodobacterales bacterium]|nr:UDP-N-acetylmuramoyl-L-alanyl-D-glutamate--2,6-diaminopimelate ligase [Rhodobacterales bacterium]